MEHDLALRLDTIIRQLEEQNQILTAFFNLQSDEDAGDAVAPEEEEETEKKPETKRTFKPKGE